MSIEKFYTTEVSTKGLTQVGATNKEVFTAKIGSLFCRIEPQGEEPVMLDEGAYFQLFRMWCEEAAIIVGDQVISGADTYIVNGVAEITGRGEDIHHLEITLALPK